MAKYVKTLVVKDGGLVASGTDGNPDLSADVTGTLPVANGGTGAASLTAHGVLLGEGTSAVTPTAAMNDGQLLIGQTSADPLPKTVSGDATLAASGALTIANNAVTTAKINDAAVTLAKQANLAQDTFIGRASGAGTGVPQALTATQATAILDAFASGTKGLAPASGGGTTNYLRADGSWDAPPGVIADGSVTLAKLANLTTQRVIGRNTAGSGVPEEVTLTQLLDWAGGASQGDILYRTGAAWDNLAAGNAGELLKTGGAGANPSWVALSTMNQYGAYASLPAASLAGRQYRCNDGPFILRDNGSGWDYSCMGFPVTDPTLQSWSWINQGSATVSTTKGGIYISCVANATTNSAKLRVATLPSTPYSYEFGFIPNWFSNGLPFMAFGWRESATGKLVLMQVRLCGAAGGTDQAIYVNQWTSATAQSTSVYARVPTSWTGNMLWIKFTDDGSYKNIYLSADGQNWNLYSGATDMTHAYGFTTAADQIFFGLNPYNADAAMWLVHAKSY